MERARFPARACSCLAIPKGYEIERLNTAVHSRAGFACGIEALDTFLATQAGQAQTKGLSSTHVLLEETAESKPAERAIIGTLTPVIILLADVPVGLDWHFRKPETHA